MTDEEESWKLPGWLVRATDWCDYNLPKITTPVVVFVLGWAWVAYGITLGLVWLLTRAPGKVWEKVRELAWEYLVPERARRWWLANRS